MAIKKSFLRTRKDLELKTRCIIKVNPIKKRNNCAKESDLIKNEAEKYIKNIIMLYIGITKGEILNRGEKKRTIVSVVFCPL